MATIITDVTELQAMENDLAGDYELGNDIDASATSGWNGGAGFDPIGDNATPFTGNFDGKGYTISELFINRPTTYYQGLFGYRTTTGEIKNVGIVNCDITGARCTGALIGYNGDGTNVSAISDCYSTGAVKASGTTWVGCLGGLVGYNKTASTIADCYSTADITVNVTPAASGLRTNEIGGLVGSDDGTSITNSYAIGAISVTITGVGDDVGSVGGFVGSSDNGNQSDCYAMGNITISCGGRVYCIGGFAGYNWHSSECYSTGNIDITASAELIKDVGGFAGWTSGDSDNCYCRGNITVSALVGGGDSIGGFVGSTQSGKTVQNCYSTGSITETGTFTDVGGFCGENNGTVTNCFWDTETSGTAVSNGGTGKTTAEMKLIATFSAWSIALAIADENNGYPYLGWQIDEADTWVIYGLSPRPTTGVQDKITLESIRNIEMSARGRFRISKDGDAVYKSRYARNA